MKIIKKKHIHRLILLLSIFFIASCELINPPEKTPSFVHIQAINLSTNVIEQGTNSSKITDAWVYVDEDIIGAFELPATIPILKTGYHKITIKPGIQLNGTAATRSIYPFYNPIELNIQLVEDQILDLGTLTTTYNNNTKFAWKEDFEQAGITIDPSSKSDTNIKKITDPNKVFEGNGSGIINLDNIKSIFEGISNVAYTLPNDGKSVFLELNFKTNNNIIIGLFINYAYNTVQHPVVQLNKTDKWTKIYINFTTIAARETTALNYKVFIGAIKDNDVDIAEILIDNIKLVHF